MHTVVQFHVVEKNGSVEKKKLIKIWTFKTEKIQSYINNNLGDKNQAILLKGTLHIATLLQTDVS